MANFELHVGKPLIAYAYLQSLRLLADGMRGFQAHAVQGLTASREHLAQLVDRSLMLVTALVPHIGYDQAAQIARHAHAQNISLQAAAQAIANISDRDFRQWVQAAAMTSPG